MFYIKVVVNQINRLYDHVKIFQKLYEQYFKSLYLGTNLKKHTRLVVGYSRLFNNVTKFKIDRRKTNI